MLNHVITVRTTKVIVAAVLAMFFVGVPAFSSVEAYERWNVVESGPSAWTPDLRVSRTSLHPEFTLTGGSSDQRARLALAVSRFRATGLALPDIEVVFTSDVDACRGHYGLYEHDPVAPRITFCSELDFVYEHELAHAWEAHSATEEQRQGFMEIRGYSVWSDASVGWNDRGIEGAAFIVQQTVGGLPAPYIWTEEFRNRSVAFEALTGIRDPRLSAEALR